MAQSDRPSAASCLNVSKWYRTRHDEVLALDDISIDFAPRQLTAVVGPSGSGKSTLLHILGCLDRPTSGEVRIGNDQISGLSRRRRRLLRRTTISSMMASPASNLVLGRSGLENIAIAARQRGGDGADTAEIVETLGIGHMLDRLCCEMSGGEQQRVALASAISSRPTIVLADEPTASLDTRSASDVITTLGRTIGLGATVVVATHDRALLEVAGAVVTLEHGRRAT